MYFFIGLHHPSASQHFQHCCISINTIKNRKSDFPVKNWILDSGAFTELQKYGAYRFTVQDYAYQIRRWSTCGNLMAAVSQDYMCAPFILDKTGLSIADHQRLTIARYEQLIKQKTGVYIMPVLQGFKAEDYLSHLQQYGPLLKPGSWVGVGSVCKRNTNIHEIEYILQQIKKARPDLRLHGFGLKITALKDYVIRKLLYSADSMAWSYHARKHKRDQNSWHEAERFRQKIVNASIQTKILW